MISGLDEELALDEVEALAVGAWILGTGGGGSPYWGCSTCGGSMRRDIASR